MPAPIKTPQYRYAGAVPKKRDRDDVTIWRYVDLAKFVQLLDRQALWFCRADRLGDPFEGSLNAGRLNARAKYQRGQRRRTLNMHSSSLVEAQILNALVNCWHMNEFESYAMWKIYGQYGVAVRSSRNRLVASLPPPNGKPQSRAPDGLDHWLDIQVLPVQYIDFSRPDIFMANPLLYKRRDFEHERELRAMVLDRSFQSEPRPTRFADGGVYIPVKLNRLVDAILISPEAPPWLGEVVTSLIARYGFTFPLQQSGLREKPKF